MVQHCIDALAGSDVTIGIVPAGTANLLAGNLGIPQDIEEAVRIALHGRRHELDVGQFNGERFAVMAGAGLDALMIDEADGTLKDRLGRVAYVWTGARHLNATPFRAVIKVDGKRWFKGKASCVLVGNVGKVFGGIEVFDGARPDDGRLDLGVITAKGPLQWARAMAPDRRSARRRSPRSSTTTTRAQDRMTFDRKVPHRARRRRPRQGEEVRIDVSPPRSTICVPELGVSMSTARRVPETWELDGDDARETLKNLGRQKLLATRSCACASPTASAMPGRSRSPRRSCWCRAHRDRRLRGCIRRQERRRLARARRSTNAVPGPASEVADRRGHPGEGRGRTYRLLPLVLGTVGAIVTGATLFGQFERARQPHLRRRTGPSRAQKYGSRSSHDHVGVPVRGRVRDVRVRPGHRPGGRSASARSGTWPCAGRSGSRSLLLAAGAALPLVAAAPAAGLCRGSRSGQPSVFSVVAVTLVLGDALQASSSFGETYGPLAGIVALQIWSLFSAIASSTVPQSRRSSRQFEPAGPSPPNLILKRGRTPVGSSRQRLSRRRRGPLRPRDPPCAPRHARQHYEAMLERSPGFEIRELRSRGGPPEFVDHARGVTGDVR